MKKVLFIIILLSFGSKAQTIKSLYDDEYAAVDGAYYKDTHNDFDNFTGTWKYTSGTTSLTITLQKKTMTPTKFGSNNIFEDVLVGGYKYIENGIVKINTVPQLYLDLDSIEYYITGNAIIGPNSQYCLDCGPNDRKVLLIFNDPDRYILGYDAQMIFQRADSGGVQKLKLLFRTIGNMIVEEGVTPLYTSYTVPFGEYILVKQ
ncbi:DUF6705 family protein [Flavobacterium sp. NRK1]|uniref:DUF6705 family protein n=1 Tax=Flavobacterium sp. NRK1 TaxID=2954929 RepID=UPI0020926D32|nr:DUF6705 family protein [Flavobacterium sp. NRK1]MCO6147541.1 hypothetical protein [Flavobacterium sp. NRK1]